MQGKEREKRGVEKKRDDTNRPENFAFRSKSLKLHELSFCRLCSKFPCEKSVRKKNHI